MTGDGREWRLLVVDNAVLTVTVAKDTGFKVIPLSKVGPCIGLVTRVLLGGIDRGHVGGLAQLIRPLKAAAFWSNLS